MVFTCFSSEKLKVLLSANEMEDYSLSYQELDYQNEETKEFIADILLLAKFKTGFDPNKSKLLIEVFPYDETGCILYFTSLSDFSEKNKKTNICRPVIFMFNDIDVLIEASSKLFNLYCHRIYKSSLYSLNNSYRLIIYPLEKCDSITTHFLSEYGTKIGEGNILASFAEEHGTLIIKDNAIDKLSLYFS